MDVINYLRITIGFNNFNYCRILLVFYNFIGHCVTFVFNIVSYSRNSILLFLLSMLKTKTINRYKIINGENIITKITRIGNIIPMGHLSADFWAKSTPIHINAKIKLKAIVLIFAAELYLTVNRMLKIKPIILRIKDIASKAFDSDSLLLAQSKAEQHKKVAEKSIQFN